MKKSYTREEFKLFQGMKQAFLKSKSTVQYCLK